MLNEQVDRVFSRGSELGAAILTVNHRGAVKLSTLNNSTRENGTGVFCLVDLMLG